MTPRRMGGKESWSYAFDRTFKGVGRIQAKAWTRKRAVFNRRDALLCQLYEDGRLDLLTAIRAGRLTIVQIEAARRSKTLGMLDATGSTAVPLWPAVEAALSRQAKTTVRLDVPMPRNSTVNGYRKSLRALRESGALGDSPVVGDLLRVDWAALEAAWGRSPASWNQVVRALSRFGTLHFGSRAHDAVVRLMDALKATARTEVPREPDVTQAAFWDALARVKAEYRPALCVLTMTGIRKGELEQLTRDDLLPITRTVQVVKKTKTETSKRLIGVPPETWQWVLAAVPLPVSMDTIGRAWSRACRETGMGRVTLHDLRHCFGQWAVDAGVDEGAVQKTMGHKTRHQTAIYTARKDRRKATGAVAVSMGVIPTQAPTSPQNEDEVKRAN